MDRSKLIVALGLITTLIFIGVAGFVLHQNKQPVTQVDSEIHNEPPPPSPNPTYLEKIKQEPFWEKLPLFNDNYKIEYNDSNDLVIITTFLPVSKTEVYKEEALSWLRENGASINELTIEFRRGVK